ncbi:unnamed protein product [Umbelopsis vinacea]
MLSTILRPDLPEATKQIFVNRIEKAAIVMTDLKADISNATSGETHPIWSELKVLGLETSPTSGLSHTAISSVHQVAESVMRMWSGNIFRRSLDRLLLVCLRKHLAPKKERAELDRKKKRKQSKKEKKLIEKYERKKTRTWNMRYDEVAKYYLLIQGCHRRIQILRRKLDNIPKKLTNQHNLSDDGEADFMKVYDGIDPVTVEDEYNMDSKVHTGEYKFDAGGYEYDTEDYDYDTEDIHTTEQDENRDSSASQRFAPSGQLSRRFFLNKIALPLVLIANSVQRVIGLGQHAHRICPRVSPAKIHSFHLDAAAIYEIMASSANEDNFVILNNMWDPVTTVNLTVDDKATTFAAFLNLGRILKICEERKMEFKYRVTVNADDTVDLLGELLPSQEPKSSFLTKRRKFRKDLHPAMKHKPTSAEQQTFVGLDAYIKRLDQQLRKRYAEKRELDDDISSLVKEPQTHIGRLQKQRYYTLKELRWRRCDLWSKINTLRT